MGRSKTMDSFLDTPEASADPVKGKAEEVAVEPEPRPEESAEVVPTPEPEPGKEAAPALDAERTEPTPQPLPPQPATFTTTTKLMVKPTQTGLSMMQERHDAMLGRIGSATRGAYPRNVLKFRECERPGYVTYSLLEMIVHFGPDVALGKALPFEEGSVVVAEDGGE